MRARVGLPPLFVVLMGGVGCADASGGPGASPEDSGVKLAAAKAPLPEETAEPDDDELIASALTGHKRQRYLADLDEIKRRGVLRVISRNSSTSYFLHRGAEAGFNYELAKLFADELGVRLEMVIPRAPRDMVPWLLQGRGDLIIGGMPVDAPRASRVHMTRPYMHTAHVVVTRKGRVPALTQLEDLETATLVVHPSSSAIKRLRRLSQETGLRLTVKASRETLHNEDLLDEVASGVSDAAVVQKRVATVELMHRDDLEIALELPTGVVESAFGVHPEHEQLWQAADDFLRRHYRGTIFNLLYWRYHKKTARAAQARDDELLATNGRFTEWDEHFKRVAAEHGLDWRLLIAQAFQESRLDPKTVSPYGAQGLMQIMPATGKELGVRDPFDPVQSIEGGGKYMGKLIARFDEPGVDLKDRIRFALAAYNVGPAHLDDARKLAAAEGLDPNRWFGNVEKALLLLSKPRYFKEARYGYCRGEEPVRYVSQIQSRYDAYVTATTEEPPQ